MKITRGQLRALVDRTEGFVDELQCELEAVEDERGNVTLKFHHITVMATPKGRYTVRDGSVRDEKDSVIAMGAIEPITNDDWARKVRRKKRRRGFGT